MNKFQKRTALFQESPRKKLISSIYPFLLAIFLFASNLFAESNEAYLKKGVVIAKFPMHFSSGYMFITVPVMDTDVYGKALVLNRSFILDPAASSDGSYMPDDSLVNVTGNRTFYLPVSEERTLSVELVPTLAKGMYKRADTSFYGVLGYAFMRKYVTVLNFNERSVTFYSTSEGGIKWNPGLDTSAIFVPYLDDAVLDHCNCSFPTIWFDVIAPPLKEGRVHLSLAERQSVIFKQALEPKTQKYIDNIKLKDSLAGKKDNFGGINLDKFELGGINIANRNPKRTIGDLPPIFRNLNIFITGTVAMDILRYFPAVIIDPTRQRAIFVK